MDNIIKYFYNINVDKIIPHKNYYTIISPPNIYHLIITDISEKEITNIIPLTTGSNLFHKIIPNKQGKYISIYNNIPYILMKIHINTEKKVSLLEISNINNIPIRGTIPPSWSNLWSTKIDYLEVQINQIGKKHPLLVDTLNFFIGLTENAISYYNHNVDKNNIPLSLTHKKIPINSTIETLYNPFNLKIDHKSRDLAEYIKVSFYNSNKNIINELNTYFQTNPYTKNDMNILFSRILYPSIYFDIYDSIILNELSEDNINKIIATIPDYTSYLDNIYNYLNKYYPLEPIPWLKKRS